MRMAPWAQRLLRSGAMRCQIAALLLGSALALTAACGSATRDAEEPDGADEEAAAADEGPPAPRGVEPVFERGLLAPASAARRARRPHPRTVFAVSIAGAPARGADDALVTIVVAREFACRFCNAVRPKLDQLLREYKGDLRVVFRDFIVHPDEATTPALAACAAHQQGQFFAMEDLIWSQSYPTLDFSRETMEKLARSLGLDIRQLRRDMKGVCRDQVRASQRSLLALGTRGTPTFWINGRTLTGNQQIDDYRDLIEAELARARRRLGKDGTTRRNYYRTWVLDRGEETFTAVSVAP
jgi:protein-disulfide isomerase